MQNSGSVSAKLAKIQFTSGIPIHAVVILQGYIVTSCHNMDEFIGIC